MTATALKPERDYLIDNLKFVLISLVVIGHFVEPYSHDNLWIRTLFIGIYSFHMPMFVFISGYLSKSENSNKPYNLIKSLLIPYLVFGILWEILVNRNLSPINLISAIVSTPFHLWYLLSLFFWKVLTPVLQPIKFLLLFSVALSIIIGVTPLVGNDFSLSRTITLFPFFIGGFMTTKNMIHSINKKKYLIALGVSTIAIVILVLLKFNSVNTNLMFWQSSYQLAGLSNVNGVINRTVLIILASVIGVVLISLMPTKKTMFSYIGGHTIVIFIFHAFILQILTRYFPYIDDGRISIFAVMAAPFLTIWLLSFSVLEIAYSKVVTFFANLILKKNKLTQSFTNTN